MNDNPKNSVSNDKSSLNDLSLNINSTIVEKNQSKNELIDEKVQ